MSDLPPARVDAGAGSGYSERMEQRREKVRPRVAAPRYGFFATALWTVLGMAVLAVGGFFVAREFFAPRYLHASGVHENRFKPIRVLSPEEAQAIAQDAPSKVWTEGVKPSDVPALPGKPAPKKNGSKTATPAKPAGPAKVDTPAVPADAPVDAPAADNTAPPASPEPTPAPSTDTPKEPTTSTPPD